MKDYFILSGTLREADYTYRLAQQRLQRNILKCTRTPIRLIETDFGVRLYFTDYSAWDYKYCFGRRDVETIPSWKFEKLLDYRRRL